MPVKTRQAFFVCNPYELSNHLGNVLAVITDKKISVPQSCTSSVCNIAWYEPEVIKVTDYFPFGSPIPERSYIWNYIMHDDFSSSLNGWQQTATLDNGRLKMEGTSSAGTLKYFNAKENKNYRLRFKLDMGSTNTVYMTVWCFNAQGVNIGTHRDMNFTANGIYEFDMPTIPGTTQIRFTFNKSGQTTTLTNFYLDDVYLYERELEGNAVAYKYGFNGKENDNEVKGEGNSLDFGARIQDPRLGRWLSTDILSSNYPSVAPFVFALNTPILAKDPDGNVVIFINGQHAGDGGRSEYWEGFDKGAMKQMGDFKARYYDGASGGWKNNTLSPLKGGDLVGVVTSTNVNYKVRIANGYAMGKAQAAEIINSLEKGETIKIVTHSMGTAYSRGFTKALQEYADANDKKITFEYQLDIAAFDGNKLPADPNVKRKEFMSGDADWLANPGKLGRSSDVPGATQVPTKSGTEHGIGNFDPTKLPVLGNGGSCIEGDAPEFEETPKKVK